MITKMPYETATHTGFTYTIIKKPFVAFSVDIEKYALEKKFHVERVDYDANKRWEHVSTYSTFDEAEAAAKMMLAMW